MSNEIIKAEVMNFHGQELITLLVDHVEYVAMKPVVENLSLDWENQRKKLNKQNVKYNPTVRSDGVTNYLCIPLKKLNLWLASISTVHIKDYEVRALVERYQEECAIALYDFWRKGIAVRTVHNPLEDLTKDALIDKLVEERVEKRIIAHDFELTRPRAKYGEISKTTGLQKTELVHSYQRSPRRNQKVSPPVLFSDGTKQNRLFEEN